MEHTLTAPATQRHATGRKINILYWVFTGIFAFFMAGSAIPDLLVMDVAVQGMHGELGYPEYLIPFLGVAKLLGVFAILYPGFPRIKEWAYAGLMIDLAGALYSILSIHKPASDWLPMLLPITFGVLSYVYYHKRLAARAV